MCLRSAQVCSKSLLEHFIFQIFPNLPRTFPRHAYGVSVAHFANWPPPGKKPWIRPCGGLDVYIQLYMFADDCKLYIRIQANTDQAILQGDISKLQLQEWSAKWFLHFHPEKCKAMCVSRQRNRNNEREYATLHYFSIMVCNWCHNINQYFTILSVLWYRLAGTPPDWRYCQINSIIIDYREQSVLIEWVVWV